MHACLEVQEILHYIFTLVYHDASGRPARRDLLSLALTSHYLAETALDILWHTQSNMVPLIKTLPGRCWKEDPISGFDRTFALTMEVPTEEDFERLTSYAKRIRKIDYLPYPFHTSRPRYDRHNQALLFRSLKRMAEYSYPLDLCALKSLADNRPDLLIPMFPNLLRAEFADVIHAERCLDIFLQTKGISLSLQWSDTDGKLTSLFPVIEKHALNMEELDLGPLQESKKEECTHLSRLVEKMAHLRRLSCASRVLDIPAIRHLASLPHVHSLSIANTSARILEALQPRIGHEEELMFPELDRLVMPESNISNLAELFKKLAPLQLQDVTIHIPEVRAKVDFRNAFEALKEGSSRFSNVYRIVIKYRPAYLFGTRRSWDQEPAKKFSNVTAYTLQPLLSLSNLAILEIDFPIQVDLGDNDFVAMANAWPSLRRLQLGQLGGWNPNLSMVTYHGFLHLLRQCPRLEHLAFTFDAASIVPTAEEILDSCINRNITYLYVGDSDIGTNAGLTVARFFARVLPNLCGFGGSWLSRSSAGQSDKKWEEVLKNLKDPKNAALFFNPKMKTYFDV